MAKVIQFSLDDDDLKRVEEMTLAGVIAWKVAKGDYVDDPNWEQLKSSYDSCHEVNELLHKKLNAVRKALNAEELVTDLPEDEEDY